MKNLCLKISELSLVKKIWLVSFLSVIFCVLFYFWVGWEMVRIYLIAFVLIVIVELARKIKINSKRDYQ